MLNKERSKTTRGGWMWTSNRKEPLYLFTHKYKQRKRSRWSLLVFNQRDQNEWELKQTKSNNKRENNYCIRTSLVRLPAFFYLNESRSVKQMSEFHPPHEQPSRSISSAYFCFWTARQCNAMPVCIETQIHALKNIWSPAKPQEAKHVENGDDEGLNRIQIEREREIWGHRPASRCCTYSLLYNTLVNYMWQLTLSYLLDIDDGIH